jgi:hypothetical protein
MKELVYIFQLRPVRKILNFSSCEAMLEILKTAHSTWGAWIVFYVFEYSRQNDTSVAFSIMAADLC